MAATDPLLTADDRYVKGGARVTHTVGAFPGYADVRFFCCFRFFFLHEQCSPRPWYWCDFDLLAGSPLYWFWHMTEAANYGSLAREGAA